MNKQQIKDAIAKHRALPEHELDAIADEILLLSQTNEQARPDGHSRHCTCYQCKPSASDQEYERGRGIGIKASEPNLNRPCYCEKCTGENDQTFEEEPVNKTFKEHGCKCRHCRPELWDKDERGVWHKAADLDSLKKEVDEMLAKEKSAKWQPGVLEKCKTGLKECACSVCNPDILNIMQRTGDEPV